MALAVHHYLPLILIFTVRKPTKPDCVAAHYDEMVEHHVFTRFFKGCAIRKQKFRPAVSGGDQTGKSSEAIEKFKLMHPFIEHL